MELADGATEEIVITAYGALADYDARLLTVAALNGAFQGRADRPVNYVNAPLIAAERGIEVREERSRSARDYTNLVRVELRGGDSRVRVAGTTIGSDHRPWLVNVLGFEIELELAPLFVLCLYDDVPGVIGRVGTLFGEAGINIAGMTVSRSRRGEKALMALTVDSAPSPELVERLRGEGFGTDPRVLRTGRGRLTLGRRRAPARLQADDGPPMAACTFSTTWKRLRSHITCSMSGSWWPGARRKVVDYFRTFSSCTPRAWRARARCNSSRHTRRRIRSCRPRSSLRFPLFAR